MTNSFNWGKSSHIPGLFTIYKKIPEILVGNFRSVRKVRVVYHLPKISGLSRRARLDSSYNMKQIRNSCKKHVNGKRISLRNFPNGENGTTFSEFLFVPGIFQWDKPQKRLPFTSQQEFPGICGKW